MHPSPPFPRLGGEGKREGEFASVKGSRNCEEKGLAVSADAGAEIIRTENLTKRFGNQIAVDRVNYVLRENEVAGIIGSNGAGKTTFFNLLTGYHLPDTGTILYQGRDITHVPPEKRVDMGMLRTFQLTSTFDNLRVIDNLVLAFFRAHISASPFLLFLTTCKRYRGEGRIAECLETFELQTKANREVKHLSLGEKRRLEIAMAVLTEPKILLLDEPLAGLAETEIKGVLGVLAKHVGKQTILIVEHKISQVEHFLQRLTVMQEGRVIADGTCEECLRAPEVRKSYWQVETPADGQGAAIRGGHSDG
jgi:ABC-type branched-subunit amino acid transport system ATPase component